MNPEYVKKQIEKHKIGSIDLKYADTSLWVPEFEFYLINSWIEVKMKEVIAVRNRPHPFEMNLYYNL
jgi:glutamine synthetase